MPSVDELLRHPVGRGLTLVAGPWDARPADSVVIIDALEDFGRVRPNAVALFTPSASPGTTGYQLDVALAEAGQRELCALAVYGAPATSLTAIRLADRARVALLTIERNVDLTDLAFGLARVIRTDPGEMLARALEGLRAIGAAEPHGIDAVLTAAERAVGSEFFLREQPTGVAVPVVADGRAEGSVCTEQDDAVALLAAHLVAATIGRIRTLEVKSARWPAQAQADALASLLSAPANAVNQAAEGALAAGVHLEEHLAVLRLEVAWEPGHDLPTRGAMDEELGDLVLAVARAERPGEAWFRSRIDGALALVHSGPPAPLPAERVLAAVKDRFSAATVFCGVGAHLRGPEGVRESAAQATTAAAAARGSDRPWTAVHIDAVGLPPMLVDWLGSRAAQLSTQRLLAPFDALDPARAETAVRTLSIYLDERGSLSRSAARLHLHKNAVAYRMKRIREQLPGIDLLDGDRRLELQLACRAWLLTRSASG